MNAVSKLQAALVSASQETTLALANLNADFSLIKIEPRQEYREIGDTLSRWRREAGEAGAIHITARRLGSLFKSIIPDVPNLLKAYGERASELSKSPHANPRGTREHGPFQEYVGIDGSSLWAAATSGDEALAIHLLACLLAAHWPAPEAIAIWTELVAERKRQLENPEGSKNISLQDVVASQLVIERAQLEEWDTSARSWLKATSQDPLVHQQQQRVLGVLRNLRLNVLGTTDVYQSVTEAWVLALDTFNKIINGASYNIHDGAVLVALSAWRLYPDLVVLGNQKQEIYQNDSLIRPGGIVTIGVTLPDLDGPSGVRWLLSLSHLKYHGPPIVVSRSSDTGDGRLTFEDFMVVILGAIIGSWNQEQYVTTDHAVQLISVFISKLEWVIRETCNRSDTEILLDQTWIKPFKNAIQRVSYSKNKSATDIYAEKLFKLGSRHRSFLFGSGKDDILYYHPRMRRPPINTHLFGLSSPGFGNVLEDEECKIDFFRGTAQRYMGASPKRPLLILRCTRDKSTSFLCTATPLAGKHYRWIPESMNMQAGSEEVVTLNPDDFHVRSSFREVYGLWCHPPEIIKQVCRKKGVKMRRCMLKAPLSSNTLSESDMYDSDRYGMDDSYSTDTQGKVGVRVRGFEFVVVADEFRSFNDMRHFITLYRLDESKRSDEHPEEYRLTPPFKHIVNTLQSMKIDAENFAIFVINSEFFRHLAFVSVCWSIFRQMPGSTISPRILGLREPLLTIHDTASSPERHKSLSLGLLTARRLKAALQGTLSMEIAFALLYTLETGSAQIKRSQLGGVFALSTDDSLFISADLLSDPANATGSLGVGVRKVKGNIGRSGAAFLIGPSETPVRRFNPDDWRLVNHVEFDGKLEDAFQDITLHLRFTGYELPIDTKKRGFKFTEAFLAEAVVSAHSVGEWLSDLNISSLHSPKLRRVLPLPSCSPQMPGVKPDCDLVTIENWEELLDPPEVPGVFKAYGNWQARLAAVCMSMQLGYDTFLFGSHGCWNCAAESFLGWKGELLKVRKSALSSLGGENDRRESIHSSSTWETDSDADVSDAELLAASQPRTKETGQGKNDDKNTDNSTLGGISKESTFVEEEPARNQASRKSTSRESSPRSVSRKEDIPPYHDAFAPPSRSRQPSSSWLSFSHARRQKWEEEHHIIFIL